MTAMNSFTQGNYAYLLCDGGKFAHWTGEVMSIETKVIKLPRINAAVGFSGVTNTAAYAEYLLRYTSQAAMLEQLPELVQRAQAAASKEGPQGEELAAEVYLSIALFDDDTRSPQVWSYATDTGPSGNLLAGLRQMRASLSPNLPNGPYKATDMLDPARFDLKRDAVALLEAQRREATLGTSRVAGFVELVRVGQLGIRSKVLHRWPDKIGRPIV